MRVNGVVQHAIHDQFVIQPDIIGLGAKKWASIVEPAPYDLLSKMVPSATSSLEQTLFA